MATLPLPSRRPARSTRARGSQVPTRQDVPQVGIPNDPGVSATPGAFGEIEANALADVGSAISAAAERVQKQTDILELTRTVGEFQTKTQEEFLRLSDQDLTLPEVTDGFDQFVQQTRLAALENFKGSADAKVKAEARLDSDAFKLKSDLAINTQLARHNKLETQLRSDIIGRMEDVKRDPSLLVDALEDIDSMVEQYRGALPHDGLNTFRKEARSGMAYSAFESFLMNGALEDARNMIENPAIVRELGVPAAAKARSRYAEIEQKFLTGQQKNADAKKETVMGKYLDTVAVLDAATPGGITPEMSAELGRHIAGLSPEELNKTEKVIDELKVASKAIAKFGGTLSSEQVVETIRDAAGIKFTPAELGERAAEEEIAKADARRKAGLISYENSDMLDGQGNPTNETIRTARMIIADLYGGTIDPVTGELGGLGPEVRVDALRLFSESMLNIRKGEARDPVEAVYTTFSRIGSDLVQPVSPADATRSIIETLNKPVTDEELQKGAEQFDLSEATGLLSGIKAAWNSSIGLLFGGAVSLSAERNRTALRMVANEWMVAAATEEAESGKVTNFTKERFETIFGGPNAFQSPTAINVRMKMLDTMLAKDLEKNMIILDSRYGTAKDKMELMKKSIALAQFRRKLNYFTSAQGKTKVETVEDVNKMSDTEFEEFMSANDATTLTTYPDDVHAAIFARRAGKTIPGGGEQPAGGAEPAGEPAAAPAKVEPEQPAAGKILTPAHIEFLNKASDEKLRALIVDAENTRPEIVGELKALLEARKSPGATKNKKKNKKNRK